MRRGAGGTFTAHAGDRWQERLVEDLLHDCGRRDRRGRVDAHAARVRADVALANPFVVLRSGERDDGVTVGEREHGDLGARQELLHDDLVACA
jgi:hypothetical protein